MEMGIRQRLLALQARQLGHPTGFLGRLIGTGLNRANRGSIAGVAAALGVQPGQVVADVGFGGGLGLTVLLDAVGPTGRVHGVEISSEMLGRARRGHRDALGKGQLELHAASMNELPLAECSLDGLMTLNTIYFVEDLAHASSELARVLKVGGTMAVGIGDPEGVKQMPVTAYGFRVRPISEVQETMERTGLVLKDHRRLGNDDHAFHVLIATRQSQ